jgi:phosphoribulokinase
MKYTNYLINGKIFDFSYLDTSNPYLKPATDIVRVVAIFAGMAGITFAFPCAVVMDSYRSVRYQFLIYNRHHLNLKLTMPEFMNRDIPNIFN